MNKDLDWLKWVGLFTVISIVVAVFYLKSQNKSRVVSNNQESAIVDQNIQQANEAKQSQMSEDEYDKKLEQAAIAIHEGQVEAKHNEENPPIYESLSIEQTKRFIERVEQLRAEDANINLDYLPDVAAQSRKYNALVEEANSIYGENDSANPMRFCSNIAWMARELWTLKHSPSSASKEYHENSRKMFLASYNDAKKACIEDINEAQK